MLIDIANLQAWQIIVGIIVTLGLSPAPWILGLATGRLQFTGPASRNYDERTAEIKAAHDLTLAEKDKTHASAMAELTQHHEVIRQFDLERYNDMKRSRDGYRTAAIEHRERADRATETALRAVEAVEATNHVLNSLNQVIAEEKTA